MDNQNAPDDIEPLDQDADFSDFDQQKGNTLGDLWRNNFVVKIGVIGAALAAVVGAIVLFGGSSGQENISSVGKTPDIKEAPGTAELTPEMKEAMETFNTQQAEDAAKNNESAMPVILEPPKEQVITPEETANEEDPFTRWRKVQEERERLEAEQQMGGQQLQVQQQQQAQIEQARNQQVEQLAQNMSQQMQSVLEARKINPQKYMVVTDIAEYRQQQQAAQQALIDQQQALAQQQADQSAAAQTTAKTILPPATINYAQLLTEANSDAPGPVLVQLASGPLAGGRLLGSFETTENFLVLKFKTLVYQGKTYTTDAVALDPNTTLPGLVTEKDRRLFSRFVLPAAAKFIEGIAASASDSGSSTIVTNGTSTTSTDNRDPDLEDNLFKGIEEGAKEVGDSLSETADTIKPMIRVAAGTPVGILFTEAVVEADPTANTAQQNQQQQNPNGFFPGVLPAGYALPTYGIPFLNPQQGTQPTAAVPNTTAPTSAIVPELKAP